MFHFHKKGKRHIKAVANSANQDKIENENPKEELKETEQLKVKTEFTQG